MREHERAYEQFVRDRFDRLYKTAFLLTGARGDAEDLLQDALERTWRQWRRGQPPDDAESYVKRALVNTAKSRWRRAALVRFVPLPAGHSDPPSNDPDIVQRRPLLTALWMLGPRQRAVVVLRYWEDLSEAETARILGCRVGTVKSQAARGLVRLREALGETDETFDCRVMAEDT